MKLHDSILDELRARTEGLSKDKVTTFAIINDLKDVYTSIIKDGRVTRDTYLSLASMLLYVGFLMEE